MATPLGLFKHSPRWRITVIAASALTVALVLVQPDPQYQPAPRPLPAANPPTSKSMVTPQNPVVAPSRPDRITRPKATATATHKTTNARSQPSSATKQKMNPAKVLTIKPSGENAEVENAPTEVVPKVDEKNVLKPSG